MERIYQYRTHKNHQQQPRTNGLVLVDNRKSNSLSSLSRSNKPVQLASRRKRKKRSDKILDELTNPKIRFKHKRSKTAYGYFNLLGKNNQGPHRISHITTSVMLEARRKNGLSLVNLLGTKIIPRPRVNNKMLRDGFALKGGQKMTKTLRNKKIKYLKQYDKLYKQASKGDEAAVEKLIELTVSQTYKWSEGFATPEEIKGKGERRKGAVEDLRRFRKMVRGEKVSKKARTIDTSGMSKDERERQSGRARQYGKATYYEELSDEDYDSESDSDVEMDN